MTRSAPASMPARNGSRYASSTVVDGRRLVGRPARGEVGVAGDSAEAREVLERRADAGPLEPADGGPDGGGDRGRVVAVGQHRRDLRGGSSRCTPSVTSASLPHPSGIRTRPAFAADALRTLAVTTCSHRAAAATPASRTAAAIVWSAVSWRTPAPSKK